MDMRDDAGSEESRFTVPTVLGEVSVRITGRDAGRPALLLLHANPGDRRDYDAVLPSFEKAHRVVGVDWPGYGQSTAAVPGRVTAEGLVAVAEQVLAALAGRGIGRLTVLGSSVGGYAALRLALRHPETITGLILVAPAGFTRHNLVTRAFCRRVMGVPPVARWLVTPLNRALLGRLRTRSARETYARARTIRDDPARLELHCAIWRSFASPGFGLHAACAGFTTRTLLIWGRRDPVVPALTDGRHARRALAHAESVVMPTGHEPYNEDPGTFLEHVTPFLERTASPGWGRGG